MGVVKEPKVAGDKDKKSKKKDKKLSVSDGAVKKASKKAAKVSELDDSAAPSKKSSKSKRAKESTDDEQNNAMNVDAGTPVAAASTPNKVSKKDAKRKRDTPMQDADSLAVATPKKGKASGADAAEAQVDKAKAEKDAKVQPPVLLCTSQIPACVLNVYIDRRPQYIHVNMFHITGPCYRSFGVVYRCFRALVHCAAQLSGSRLAVEDFCRPFLRL